MAENESTPTAQGGPVIEMVITVFPPETTRPEGPGLPATNLVSHPLPTLTLNLTAYPEVKQVTGTGALDQKGEGGFLTDLEIRGFYHDAYLTEEQQATEGYDHNHFHLFTLVGYPGGQGGAGEPALYLHILSDHTYVGYSYYSFLHNGAWDFVHYGTTEGSDNANEVMD